MFLHHALKGALDLKTWTKKTFQNGFVTASKNFLTEKLKLLNEDQEMVEATNLKYANQGDTDINNTTSSFTIFLVQIYSVCLVTGKCFKPPTE